MKKYTLLRLRMRKMIHQIFYCILFGVTVQTVNGQAGVTTIIDVQLRRHMEVLAHDSLEGRGVGTPGCEKAAEYIRSTLQSYGIKATQQYPSYLQTFPLHGSRPVEGTSLKVISRSDTILLQLQNDYVLFSSGAQTFIPLPTRMVFVGYGIVAPEYDYNDYRNIDVKNAVVVFLTGEPRSNDDTFFAGEKSTTHSSFVMKQKIALSRGAKGSILVPNPNELLTEDWIEVQSHFLFEEVRLPVTPSENLNIMVGRQSSNLFFSGAEYSLDEIAGFDRAGAMKSFPLPGKISFQGKFKERDFRSSNVIAMIEGSDPILKDSYLLLTAHYDHLGIGVSVNGDSIYNGLMDNASGTSALLEIARMLSHPDIRPRRSVIIAFLTGEERGFLGSQYYCFNPVVPLHKTFANINIDGISLFEQVRSVIALGSEMSTLREFVDTALVSTGILCEEIPEGIFNEDQFRKSDQYIFAQAGIPSMLVSEGFQFERTTYDDAIARYAEWSDMLYHSPFDDLHQPMDFSAAAQHTNIIVRIALTILNSEVEPAWHTDIPFLQERLRSIAEKR